MKTILIALAVLLIIGGGYYWYMSNEEMTAGDMDDMETEDEMMEENNAPEAKLDINVVCEGALAYMSFPDGESAEQFVAECKAGEHPEVIERYKAEMNLGDGAEV